ncbi:hypothetical protein Hanom_Chr14g01272701 [Helianthus anomalus]
MLMMKLLLMLILKLLGDISKQMLMMKLLLMLILKLLLLILKLLLMLKQETKVKKNCTEAVCQHIM